MKELFFAVLLAGFWIAGAIYSAFCLWMPEIRPHHRIGFLSSVEERRMGWLACFGLAMTFWLPPFVYIGIGIGLIPELFSFAVFGSLIPGVIVLVIGSVVDVFG